MNILYLTNNAGSSKTISQKPELLDSIDASSHVITLLNLQDTISAGGASFSSLNDSVEYWYLAKIDYFASLFESNQHDLLLFGGVQNWLVSYIARLYGVPQLVVLEDAGIGSVENENSQTFDHISPAELALLPYCVGVEKFHAARSGTISQGKLEKDFDSEIALVELPDTQDAYWNQMPAPTEKVFELPHDIEQQLIHLRNQDALIVKSFERRLGSLILVVPKFFRKLIVRIDR
jgi:hypothetical protein